jgi:hypothetical protein
VFGVAQDNLYVEGTAQQILKFLTPQFVWELDINIGE